MDDEDLKLVFRAQSGDKKAYADLVKRYYEMVYFVAFGILNQAEDAKDTAQNVFLKLYQDIVKFEGRSKFKSWLYRIAVNAALDEARKRRPTDPISGDDFSEDKQVFFQSPGPSPLDDAVKKEKAEKVRDALAQLTADHRAVLFLREWEGHSYEEIAEILKIGIGTVMSRIHYAKKRLAEILSGNREAADLKGESYVEEREQRS